MTTCPKCGFELPAEAQECPSCGVILAKARAATPPAPSAARDEILPEPPTLLGGPTRRATQLELSPATIETWRGVRPWMTFLAIYGFLGLGMALLVGAGMLLTGLANPRLLPVGLIYLVYGFVGLAIVLPLHRSAKALRDLSDGSPGAAFDTFTGHQAAFWRRAGLLAAVGLAIVAIGLVLAVVFGALAAVLR